MNLSFAGCGFLGIYHVGVVSCFREYAPNLVKQLSGASAGAIAACCYLCDCSLSQITSDTLKVVTLARSYRLGPFHPKFVVTRILQERLDEILPEDAHLRCSGRLRVSVTRVSDGKNIILTNFSSKSELIQALQCSSFIPVFSGIMPPTYRGVRYIDGCYSDNLPILDENTVTVSPFCGESDICPRDNCYNFFQFNWANTSIELSAKNLYRFFRILFPPHPEILSQMCKQGFEDALHYLQKNNLINCARCIAINSTLQLQEACSTSDSDDCCEDVSGDEENCLECKMRQQVALLDDLPEAVLSVFEDACKSVNKGLLNWIFKHKTMRFLSVLTLPYILPLDIACIMFARLIEMAPKLSYDIIHLIKNLFRHVKMLLRRFTKHRHLYSAKFSCQLAITEYDYETEASYIGTPATTPVPQSSQRCSVTSVDEFRAKRKSVDFAPQGACRVLGTMNLGFTVDVQSQKSSEIIAKPLVTAHGADQQEEAVVDIANAALHWDTRKAEVWDSQVDTFDNILEVTQKQDALMAYYYLDEENRVKVTEIFNVAGASARLSSDENRCQSRWDDDEWSDVQNASEKWFLPTPAKLPQASSSTPQTDSAVDCSYETGRTSDETFSSLLTDDSFVPLESISVVEAAKSRRDSFIIMDP